MQLEWLTAIIEEIEGVCEEELDITPQNFYRAADRFDLFSVKVRELINDLAMESTIGVLFEHVHKDVFGELGHTSEMVRAIFKEISEVSKVDPPIAGYPSGQQFIDLSVSMAMRQMRVSERNITNLLKIRLTKVVADANSSHTQLRMAF